MSGAIYIEGGGDDSKELHARCREGFRKLFEKCGFAGRMPKLVACGGRDSTFSMFLIAFEKRRHKDYVAMLVDSEDPVDDIDQPWQHLHNRDGWSKPDEAEEFNALMMTTCMETWIVCDREALKSHYGSGLQESALPHLSNMEERDRHAVQNSLIHATRNCRNAYSKGKRSFEVLQKIDPNTIQPHLPSFERVIDILNNEL